MKSKHDLIRLTWLILAGLVIALASPACSQTAPRQMPVAIGDGGWEAVYNLPHGLGVCGLFFVDAKRGWAVGGEGTILKTTNGGVTWSSQVSGVKSTVLWSIWFTDADNGCIVGHNSDMNGVILRTTDSGATWKAHEGPKGLGLRSICFSDAKNGWALGHRKPTNDKQKSNDCGLLKTTDGGATWSAMPDLPMKSWAGDCDVRFVDSTHGWVSGGYNGVLRTVDGGKTWHKPTMQPKSDTGSVCFIDARNGWACGSARGGPFVARTADGGDTWEDQTSGMPQESLRDGLRSIHFLDSKNGWACGTRGTIVRTADGGVTWSVGSTDSEVAQKRDLLRTIRFADSLNGWSAGDDGNIMRTTDGGKTWASLQPRILSGVCATFLDSRTGWITGREGAILKTADGGLTWVQQRPCGEDRLSHIRFANDKVGLAIGSGGVVLATEDGGETWTRRSSWLKGLPSGELTYAMHAQFLDARCGWLLVVHTPAPTTGWTYGIRRTTDGGKTWEALSTGTNTPIWDACFADRETGWLVGPKGTVMKTTDGGKTWKRKFTGVTKCHASVWFVDSKVGWIAGQDGLIFKSTDGGETWARQESGTQEGMHGVCFRDASNGWIDFFSGDGLLVTNDGGKTWTRRDIGRKFYYGQFVDQDFAWTSGYSLVRTTTGGLPGCVWAKKQPDGKPANFGHLVVTETTSDGLYAVHPDSKIGMRFRIKDTTAKVGDYIYIHGKIASDGAEKVIDADSVDVITAGWGYVKMPEAGAGN